MCDDSHQVVQSLIEQIKPNNNKSINKETMNNPSTPLSSTSTNISITPQEYYEKFKDVCMDEKCIRGKYCKRQRKLLTINQCEAARSVYNTIGRQCQIINQNDLGDEGPICKLYTQTYQSLHQCGLSKTKPISYCEKLCGSTNDDTGYFENRDEVHELKANLICSVFTLEKDTNNSIHENIEGKTPEKPMDPLKPNTTLPCSNLFFPDIRGLLNKMRDACDFQIKWDALDADFCRSYMPFSLYANKRCDIQPGNCELECSKLGVITRREVSQPIEENPRRSSDASEEKENLKIQKASAASGGGVAAGMGLLGLGVAMFGYKKLRDEREKRITAESLCSNGKGVEMSKYQCNPLHTLENA